MRNKKRWYIYMEYELIAELEEISKKAKRKIAYRTIFNKF